jgi:hypothetical protein
METIISDLRDEQDYKVQKAIVDRAIPRLIRDRVLIKPEGPSGDGADPCLLVHPNYIGGTE